MKYLVSFAALAALASPGVGQEQANQSEMLDAGTIVSRSMTISSDIASAVVPYVLCLSKEMQAQPATLWEPNKVHPAADLVKKQCVKARDDAIFLAATALERIGGDSIDERKKMVLETLAAVENQAFVAPPLPAPRPN